jgi:lipid-A-disaccharide synthase
MLIAYKANPLSIWLVKRLIQIPYICMVNILLKRQVVPEFIQQHCRADTLSKALLDLMTNDSLREKQLRAFDRVEAMLSPQGKTPSGAGADVVVSLVR